MSGVNLAPNQELLLKAFLDAGIYASKSEIHRAAIEALVQSLPPQRRLAVALAVYRSRNATITYAADVAGLAFGEMRDVLAAEGMLRHAGQDPDGAIVEFTED